MRILVAYDGSRCAEGAIEEVLRRPWPPGTRIRIESVLDWPAPLLIQGMGASTVALESVREDGMARLRSLQAQLRRRFKDRPELEVDYVIREGSVKHVLLDGAREFGADLLMIGSHGTTAIGRIFVGSVCHAMVAHAPCSVEVVRVSRPA